MLHWRYSPSLVEASSAASATGSELVSAPVNSAMCMALVAAIAATGPATFGSLMRDAEPSSIPSARRSSLTPSVRALRADLSAPDGKTKS